MSMLKETQFTVRGSNISVKVNIIIILTGLYADEILQSTLNLWKCPTFILPILDLSLPTSLPTLLSPCSSYSIRWHLTPSCFITRLMTESIPRFMSESPNFPLPCPSETSDNPTSTVLCAYRVLSPVEVVFSLSSNMLNLIAKSAVLRLDHSIKTRTRNSKSAFVRVVKAGVLSLSILSKQYTGITRR